MLRRIWWRSVGAVIGFFVKQSSRIDMAARRCHAKWGIPIAQNFDNDYVEQMEALIAQPQEFEALPKTFASQVSEDDQELRQVVEMYFLTKQTIAICEARSIFLPLQVYNEFRSALDHYMRAVTAAKDPKNARSKHLRSMEGHIQRAFLDMVKLGCADIRAKIDVVHKSYRKEALGIAGCGHSYMNKMHALLFKAEQLLTEAKAKEPELGDTAEAEVRHAFLVAFRAHYLAHEHQKNSIPMLMAAQSKTLEIFGLKLGWAVFARAIAFFVAGVIAAPLVRDDAIQLLHACLTYLLSWF